MKYVASAPGSLMLFGEHAVLHGMQSVCCAVNQRMQVTLVPRGDGAICLYSALGNFATTLSEFTISPRFQFVLTAIDYYRQSITEGFDLYIDADFASTVGLGSSSAVTVATVGVLSEWLGVKLSKLELFEIAKSIILAVQGLGSGADVAAAVFGGIVAYRADPLEIIPLDFTHDIALVYSGAKVPTREVIQFVAEKQQQNPEAYEKIFAKIDVCAKDAVAAIQAQDWKKVGALMNAHQKLHAELGVSTPLIETLIQALCAQPHILGAKISGSGMGDSVIGLGNLQSTIFPQNSEQTEKGVKEIPVKISTEGYVYGKA